MRLKILSTPEPYPQTNQQFSHIKKGQLVLEEEHQGETHSNSEVQSFESYSYLNQVTNNSVIESPTDVATNNVNPFSDHKMY